MDYPKLQGIASNGRNFQKHVCMTTISINDTNFSNSTLPNIFSKNTLIAISYSPKSA